MEQQIAKGLAGVTVDVTSVSKVNPETNSLLYRGYPVQELAASAGVEEVAWLLWHGELPTADELAGLSARERAGRELDPAVTTVLDTVPTTAHPMDVVRTAVSVLGATDPTAEDLSPDATLAQAERLWAKLPAVIAADQRRRRGLPPVAPDPSLDWSTNLLAMTFDRMPEPIEVDTFRIAAILYAEHSFNASTFTARVIASTLGDLYSAVTGAVGALKGPLHGGANEAVLHTFEEIGLGEGAGERAVAWLDSALAEKRKIMGFGHRVYKNGDSRVPTMEAALRRLAVERNRPDVIELYDALRDAMVQRKGIQPNLDYPSGPAYALLGFDAGIMTPLFVASRVLGWTAHVREQLAANALIRPLSAYIGHEERHLAR